MCKPLSFLENLLYVQSLLFHHTCINLGMHDLQFCNSRYAILWSVTLGMHDLHDLQFSYLQVYSLLSIWSFPCSFSGILFKYFAAWSTGYRLFPFAWFFCCERSSIRTTVTNITLHVIYYHYFQFLHFLIFCLF